MKSRGRVSRSVTKTKRVSAKKAGLSWQDIAALSVVLVILVGIALAAKSALVDPSEAAVMRQMPTTMMQQRPSGSSVQRSAQEQEWVEEILGYWDEYNKCFVMSKGPAKCDCLNAVIKKFEALKQRILADGKDHSQFLAFWYDYYLKLIRQTWEASDCGGASGGVSAAKPSAVSVFSRLSQFFRRF